MFTECYRSTHAQEYCYLQVGPVFVLKIVTRTHTLTRFFRFDLNMELGDDESRFRPLRTADHCQLWILAQAFLEEEVDGGDEGGDEED